MDIVVEGPDACGKSTLCQHLQLALDRPIVASEGPEKYPLEIIDRINRWYKDYHEVIYDRHPVISQSMYRALIDSTEVPLELRGRFYLSSPLLIYCQPPADHTLDNHVKKEHDTPEHLAAINARGDEIISSYTEWAKYHAHIYYRMGNDPDLIVSLVRGAIQGETR